MCVTPHLNPLTARSPNCLDRQCVLEALVVAGGRGTVVQHCTEQEPSVGGKLINTQSIPTEATL